MVASFLLISGHEEPEVPGGSLKLWFKEFLAESPRGNVPTLEMGPLTLQNPAL